MTSTPPTDTAVALEAAIDALIDAEDIDTRATVAAEAGDKAAAEATWATEPIALTRRTELRTAIAAHVDAEVARRLAVAPEVEVEIDSLRPYLTGGATLDYLMAAIAADKAHLDAEWQAHDRERDAEVARAQADTREATRALLAICATVGAADVPTGDGWCDRVVAAVIERIAADKARAVEAESIAAIDEFRRILTAPRAAGVPCPACKVAARPAPDEARRLVMEYANAVHCNRATDDSPWSARTALLRALGVEA